MLTVESATKELKELRAQFFAEIGKLMDEGLDHTGAVMKLSKDSPDLQKREHQLLAFLKLAKQSGAQVELSDSRADRGGEENVTFSERESTLKLLEDELDLRTRAKMAGTNLQYFEALKLVASENPELDKKRTRLTRG